LTLTPPLRLDLPGGRSTAPFQTPTLTNLEKTMLGLFRGAACFLALVAIAGVVLTAAAAETSFPFGSALLLDTPPLPGTKRVPTIEIDQNGTASIHLWCAEVRGDASVADSSITIVPKQALPSQCPPQSISRDASLLVALSQVTGWSRHDDIVEFVGTTPLRFRLMTN
jgi:hypothetical protein